MSGADFVSDIVSDFAWIEVCFLASLAALRAAARRCVRADMRFSGLSGSFELLHTRVRGGFKKLVVRGVFGGGGVWAELFGLVGFAGNGDLFSGAVTGFLSDGTRGWRHDSGRALWERESGSFPQVDPSDWSTVSGCNPTKPTSCYWSQAAWQSLYSCH